ncbi:MAG: PIG-L family deacetylase [Erythrobacter sp.]
MIRTIAVLALAATMPLAAQEPPAPPITARKALVVLAHPDDELPMAPAIAALAREGMDVQLFYASEGEAGPGLSGLAPGAALGKVRRAEADCAAKALGVALVVNVNGGDGSLGITAHRDGSAAKALTGDLNGAIAGTTLILTWGPDGGYGHADHRMVSALTTQLVQTMPAATRPKLLYVGIPNGQRPPVAAMADWATTDPALLTETIAYTPADLAAANTAAQCHVTQFDQATRAGIMPLFDATMWRGKVYFRPAF